VGVIGGGGSAREVFPDEAANFATEEDMTYVETAVGVDGELREVFGKWIEHLLARPL
jgi:hypothetical protein